MTKNTESEEKPIITISVKDYDECSFGELKLGDLSDKSRETYYVLGLPFKDNQRSISRIPDGIYDARKKAATEHIPYEHILIEGTGERTGILIHIANWVDELEGCFAIGIGFMTLSRSYLVCESKRALEEVLRQLPDSFRIRLN